MREPANTADPDLVARPGRRWTCRFALVSLFAVHIALTLQLFGRSAPWRKLTNADPVTSGRHPLHLEEGGRDGGSAFDPTGYAGYPRTPVFDSEARPAEWFQFMAGGVPAQDL